MHVAILTNGTRGDIQPYAVIGHELKNRGMKVTMAVNEKLVGMVEGAGLTAVPIPIDNEAALIDEHGETYLAAGKVPQFLGRMARELRANREALGAALIEASQGADVIITSLLTAVQAASTASAQGQRLVPVFIYPCEPTSDYPWPYLAPSATVPSRALRRATHHVAERAICWVMKANAQVFCEQIGQPRCVANPFRVFRKQHLRTLNVISRHLLPEPADWPRHVTNIGTVGVPSSLRSAWGEIGLPRALSEWLDAGPPPVFFGFGSLPLHEPAATVAMFSDAVRRLGVRAVVAARWENVGPGPDGGADEDVFVAHGNLNHDQLLSRCVAAVHHGGVGTTHSACLAGVPAVVAYMFFDQGFWGRRLTELGIGSSLPYRSLTSDRLVDRLRPLLNGVVKDRVERIASAMRGERPVDAIVAELESGHRSSFKFGEDDWSEDLPHHRP